MDETRVRFVIDKDGHVAAYHNIPIVEETVANGLVFRRVIDYAMGIHVSATDKWHAVQPTTEEDLWTLTKS